MNRKMVALGLAVCLLPAAGCFDVEQAMTLQKDLSGKAAFSMTVNMEPMVLFMVRMQREMAGQKGEPTAAEIDKARKEFLAFRITDTETTEKTASGSSSSQKKKKKKAASRVVSLRVVPTAAVWVCLENASGKRLIPGQELSADSPKGPYRSSKFHITLGNGNAILRVNGKSTRLRESAEGQGFTITRNGRTTLSPAKRPTCA